MPKCFVASPMLDPTLANGQNDFIWIPEDIVNKIVHDAQIERFGGSGGLLSPNGLAAALARPMNRHFYEGENSVFRLAAIYASGIIRNHPYVDGNKRTGYALAYTFLLLNGMRIAASDDEKFNVVIDLAKRKINEEEFSNWLESHSHPLQ